MARTGRPTSYRHEYTKQAYHLALLGATDADLARAFDVDEATIRRWKGRNSDFCAALKKGKDDADGMVAKSLYRRALGYSHKAVKILAVAQGNNQGSTVEEVPYTEHYPPDTTACIFWLKNRRPDLWRDKPPEDDMARDVATIIAALRSAGAAMNAADGLTDAV